MQTAFNKEVRRSITHSLGRFLAIAVIVALGAGFYAGLRMTPIDMNVSADQFYDATNFSDIRVVGTLGLEDEDISELEKTEGVSGVQPVREVDSYASIDGTRYVVRLDGLDLPKAQASDVSDGKSAKLDDSNYINRPVLVSGTWPSNDSECVISADAVLDYPVELGAELVLQDDSGDIGDTLEITTFKVVGTVRAPYYVSTTSFGSTELGSGTVDTYAYIANEAFVQDRPYAGAYVTVTGARDLMYPSEAYDQQVDSVVSRLESKADYFNASRLDAVKGEAQRELDSKRSEFESDKADANAKLANGKAELDSARSELNAVQDKLEISASQIEESKELLASTKAELDSNAATIEALRAQKTQGESDLAQARSQLEAAYAAGMIDAAAYTAQSKFLDEKQAELVAGEQAIAQYDAGVAAYEAGVQQLADGEQQYESGLREYELGLSQYESGLAEYQENRAKADREFADAEQKLAEAQAEIDEIESPSWYVLDRSKNMGAESHISDASRIDKIAQVFPFIFFLVAALVALTTMTRMVEEERVLIGTHKALGYSNATIISKYFVYGFTASAAGAVLGIVLFSQVLPKLIIDAYGTIYAITVAVTPVDLPIAALSFGLGVGITVGATWIAASTSLRERPAALMLPRAPKPGKRIVLERIRPLWAHMSFTRKVTARNLFRYKRRFFMAVIGIAGCTALLLTGLGLHDGINDIIDKQFGELLHYNLTIQVDEEQLEDDKASVQSIMNDSVLVDNMTAVNIETCVIRSKTAAKDQRGSLVVLEDLEFMPQYITLRTRLGHEPISLQDDGAVINEKLATELGVGPGDTFEIYEQNAVGDAVGNPHEVRVTAVSEYYAGQYVYMTPVYYKTVFNHESTYTSILANAPGSLDERTALQDQLLAVDGVEVVSYYDEVIQTYRTMLKTVDSVVWILVIAAAALAFVVLYNLTNINITERVREIATLKVLGFTPGEVNAYIFRETLLLTIIGAFLGCFLGIWMEGFVITSAEVDLMMFGREIHLISFVIAFVLTVFFSLIVTAAMRKKLRRIDMVESLKSIE